MMITSRTRPAAHRCGLAVVVAAAVLLGVAPAAAALPVLVGDRPDGGVGGADARVEAIARSGGRIYLGGSFTTVGGQPHASLAAVDAASGQVVSTWQADVAGRVTALAPSADGSTLYVGGEFTAVGGVSRTNLAAVRADTGAVTGWNPGANRVQALAASPTRVYVGGKFGRIGGVAWGKLAAVDPSTGAVDQGFAPNPDQWVAALRLSADGQRLYAAGFFTAIGGVGQRYLAALSPATGGAAAAWRPSLSCPAYALDVTGTAVYVACGGTGGSALAFSAVTGAQLWVVRTDGNLHAVAFLGDAVYLGGHFTTVAGAARKKGAAVDAATGALTAWNPSFDSPLGVFAMLAVDGRLWAGGDFTRVGTTRQPHVCRFS
jgi:trimeric autotransporter adhesin